MASSLSLMREFCTMWSHLYESFSALNMFVRTRRRLSSVIMLMRAHTSFSSRPPSMTRSAASDIRSDLSMLMYAASTPASWWWDFTSRAPFQTSACSSSMMSTTDWKKSCTSREGQLNTPATGLLSCPAESR